MKLRILAGLLIGAGCAAPVYAQTQIIPAATVVENARQLRGKRKFADAQKLLETRLALVKIASERDALRLALADLHFAWATDLRDDDDDLGAIGHYQKAYAINKVIRPHNAGIDLTVIGAAYNRLNRYEDALDAYQRALALHRAAKTRPEEADVLNNIGVTYDNLGRSDDAVRAYREALAIYQQIKDEGGQATTWNNIGAAYDALGRAEESLRAYEQALLFYRQTKNQGGEAGVWNNIGAANDSLDRYQDALSAYQKALAISQQTGDVAGQATTLLNIGAAYDSLSQPETALSYYQRALPLSRETKDQNIEATVLQNIGAAYDTLGRTEEALRSYDQALDIYRQTKDLEGESSTLLNIGVLYDKHELYSQALGIYDRALLIQRQIKDRTGEAVTLHNMGFASERLGDIAAALRFYARALPIYRAIQDRGGEADTLSNLMWAQEDLQPAVAIFYGKQSINLYQSIRRDIAGLDATSRAAYLKGRETTYRELARLLIAAGRFAEAEEVLAMVQQQEFLDFVRRDARGVKLESAASTLVGAEQTVVAQQDAHIESIAKLSAEEFALSGLENPDAQQSARLEQVQKSLAAARADLDAFFAAMPARFARNAADVQTDKRELSAIVPLLREMGAQTGSKVALISAFADDKGLELLLTLPTGQTVNLSYAAENEDFPSWLNAQIFEFTKAIEARAPVENAATALWNILGCKGQLSAQLEGAQIDTVMWRLTGPLRALPLAALRDGDGYLVEKYRNIVLTAGSSELNLAHQPVKDWRALGVGVTKAWKVKGDQFSALSGVAGELKAVMDAPTDGFGGGVLPGRVLMDGQFSEANFFRLMRGPTPESNAPWQVVHIASHFKLAGDSLQSFLLTGDGKALTIADLQQRATTNPLFPGVELMTLSACDTAAGSGADSLGALAELNGAKAVLATLWPVADAETAQLMSDFYANHAAQPAAGKAIALQSAQLKLLRAGGNGAHPYYWAPFVLMGNWR